MTTIVDLTVPGEALPLGGLLESDDDIRIEVERVVPLGDRVLPFFWVSDESVDHIEAVIADQPEVDDYRRLTSTDDQHLYEVRWSRAVDGLLAPVEANDGVVLSGAGVHGRWELRLRFPDHERLQAFNRECRERDIRFDVNGVYNPRVPTVRDRLTPKQWETMAVAHEIGYFEVPRRATLEDLADHFDVSEQAVSQRIRRALNTLLGSLRFDSPER